LSTLALLQRALAEGAETPADAVSERILDAALDLAGASGLRNLTMDQVARRAGVGRMTVYRRFGDRDGLVQALTVRESRRCLAELDSAADVSQPMEEQIAEGFVVSLRLAATHPLLARLATAEGDVVLQTLTARRGGVFTVATTFLAERLRAAQRSGVLPADVDVDAVAELLVRLTMSFVLLPASTLPLHDEERLRDIARRHLVPLVVARRS
jgi:AcrR family transcriptional regulator